MALVRWKWVDYLNIELYEHNLKQLERPTQAETQIYYDSDEELFFERLNYINIRRFVEANILRHRITLRWQYYNAYRAPRPPPAYIPIVRLQ